MTQDANRGRRDIRVYSWICAVGAAVAAVAAILMWDDGGQNDVSIVFLVLAVLLLPPSSFCDVTRCVETS